MAINTLRRHAMIHELINYVIKAEYQNTLHMLVKKTADCMNGRYMMFSTKHNNFIVNIFFYQLMAVHVFEVPKKEICHNNRDNFIL